MKRIVLAAMALALLLSLSPRASAAVTTPQVAAKSAILMEKSTGRILSEQNSHEKLSPASVTKVMSLLLICEALNDGRISLTDIVTCSEHAASMGGSQIYLEPGEKMSVEDLLKSVVLGSANDAVVALAEYLSGSEDAFVALMNERAAALGCQDTNFLNACGLDVDGHVTSAHDIALMSRALLLEYPDIRNYTTIWMDSVRNGAFQLTNTNRLIRSYDGMTGLKTGFTSRAGHCLSATAERDGMELICVVLGSSSSAERFDAARGLLDFGFANYTLCEVWPEGALSQIPVTGGRGEWVQPEILSGNSILIEKSALNGIEREVNLAQSVQAPVAAGDVLGEMIVRSGDTELLRVPITAAEAVEKLTLGDVFSKLIGLALFKP